MDFLTNIIKDLSSYHCKLVRSGSDYDFLLLDATQRDNVKTFLINKGFILFIEEKNKLNFKKYEQQKLIDIDIDTDIDTSFLKTFFYDIETTQALKQRYFTNPDSEKLCINAIRYMLLLRGFDKKYYQFFITHKDFILKHHFCLNYLSKNPFKKEFKSFEDFLGLIKRDTRLMFKYLKFKYIVQFYKVKFFKKKAKLISFIGIDGSGKSTIIDILSRDFGYKSYYLGDRSIKLSKLYQISYLKPISIFIQYFEKLFRVSKLQLYTLRGKHIITDRYYFESNTTTLKGKVYNLLYNKLFLKPDIAIVLYADANTILKRKQEVSKQEIEEFNKHIKNLPFNNKVIIKNENLDTTLNQILEYLK